MLYITTICFFFGGAAVFGKGWSKDDSTIFGIALISSFKSAILSWMSDWRLSICWDILKLALSIDSLSLFSCFSSSVILPSLWVLSNFSTTGCYFSILPKISCFRVLRSYFARSRRASLVSCFYSMDLSEFKISSSFSLHSRLSLNCLSCSFSVAKLTSWFSLFSISCWESSTSLISSCTSETFRSIVSWVAFKLLVISLWLLSILTRRPLISFF